jgi:hypothetical protein
MIYGETSRTPLRSKETPKARIAFADAAGYSENNGRSAEAGPIEFLEDLGRSQTDCENRGKHSFREEGKPRIDVPDVSVSFPRVKKITAPIPSNQPLILDGYFKGNIGGYEKRKE